MSKTDISKTNLNIKYMYNVIRSENSAHDPKLLKVRGRHSDAFIYILSGSCTYIFDDGYTFTVKSGNVLYLSDKSVYTMQIHSDEYKFIFCDFQFDCDLLRRSDVFSPKNGADTEYLFKKILKLHLSGNFCDSMSVLYQIYGTIFTSTNLTYIGGSIKQKIEEAKLYIDTNFYDSNLCVSCIAKNSEMSEVYFRKCFKAAYGISPGQYIISVRLNKAKELMQYPFLSLTECSEQSGFSTVQYFCRVFKKHTGLTPAKYRKEDK